MRKERKETEQLETLTMYLIFQLLTPFFFVRFPFITMSPQDASSSQRT